jgi:hypothetical protein
MCAFAPLAASFIKALDVIAAACPLPEKRHHMFGPPICGMWMPRCIRKVTNEDVARIGSVKCKAQWGWRKHCGSVGGVETTNHLGSKAIQ